MRPATVIPSDGPRPSIGVRADVPGHTPYATGVPEPAPPLRTMRPNATVVLGTPVIDVASPSVMLTAAMSRFRRPRRVTSMKLHS